MKERYQSKVAVFLILTREENGKTEILLQERYNTGYMDGKYDAACSGHLEKGESVSMALVREAKEESNVTIKSAICYGYRAHTSPNGKNWLDFMFITNDFDYSKLKNQESEVEPWMWVDVHTALSMDLFPPTRNSINIALDLGLISEDINIPSSNFDSNIGNGYFPDCDNVYEMWKRDACFYVDDEGCSYSFNENNLASF